ncbi:AFG2-interacting ribosome maturation factor isoform X1 [Balearica regulorum gibbericeps]|uniref:AFG2-interacting ribosome maturation factor isoform X1 n=1 Tax=Balearica regulorum gibbericeps TaxID=100784 RepID=UPI003F6401DB
MAAAVAAMAAALREWAAVAARQDAAWRAVLAAWAPLLGSLSGLAAQIRAAQRLAWGGSPLRAFGDLRVRLWRKQRGAAEALLEQLGVRRAELRAVRDAVGAGVAGVLRLYEERAAELGLAAALRRGPRCPSLADALEGLQDVERYYRHLYPSAAGLSGQRWRVPFPRCCPYRARRYLESKLLLRRVSCANLADMEALPQSWERILERYKEDVVQDMLLKISLFVDNHRELCCSPGS